MGTGHDDARRTLEVLTREECWGYLRRARLGRLVFTEAALPAVVLVPFAVVGEELVVATTSGSRTAVTALRQVVAVQVDDADALTRTGWSVTAVGSSHRMGDTHLAATLRAGGLVPWAPTAWATYTAISVRLLKGSRLSRDPAPR